MKQQSKLVLATILAGSIGLAGLGISRAQTANTVETATSTVDTAVTTTATDTTTATTPMFGRGGHHAERLAKQAEKFGMTAAELQSAIESGKPMYQIAAEHGVTFAQEQATRLAELKTRLDDMVNVKYMTQAEADAAYAAAQNTPMMGGGFGGPHGPR